MSSSDNGTVMAVFAHPDDEAFGVGGSLAALAALGNRVVLVCATSGEVGEISDPALATPETLGAVRERELRCSCEALGIEPPVFLGYRDSGMIGTPENEDPRCLAAADLDEVTGRVVRLVRELRPQVLFTFDAGGGYGHPDHIAIHHATKAAYARAGDASCYPEQLADGLAPHAPERLLYVAIPRYVFRDMVARMREVGADVSAFDGFDTESVGTADEDVNLSIDVTRTVDAKFAALECHATQLSGAGPWAQLPPEELRAFFSTEYFTQAEPPVEGMLGGDLLGLPAR